MENSVSSPYEKIAKGRGFVYAHDDQLYQQIKKKGGVLYFKRTTGICDGSAKLQNGVFSLQRAHSMILRLC